MKEKNKLNAIWLVAAVAGIGALSVWGATRALADEKGKGGEAAGHEDHDHDDHDHEKMAGPNGGRILHSVEPHLEFLVMEDRKIRISALDEDMKKVVPIGDQVVNFIGGSRSKPTRLSFVKEDGYLVSDGVLPEGKNFPAILQIKVTPDAKSVLDRFQLDLNNCPTCKYLEYACICDHGHEHGEEGHDHDHKHDAPKKGAKPLKK